MGEPIHHACRESEPVRGLWNVRLDSKEEGDLGAKNPAGTIPSQPIVPSPP